MAFDRASLKEVRPIPEEAFRQGADGYLATVAPVYGAVSSIDACLGAYCQHGDNHSDFADRLAERARWRIAHDFHRSEEHTSELQSLMRISYAVFCLKKKKPKKE